MADVISFNSSQSDKSKEYTNQEICKVVLDDLMSNLNSLKDLYIFYKTEDNLINIIHTDVDFRDRSVMFQLLQHHLNLDLNTFEEEYEEIEPNE